MPRKAQSRTWRIAPRGTVALLLACMPISAPAIAQEWTPQAWTPLAWTHGAAGGTGLSVITESRLINPFRPHEPRAYAVAAPAPASASETPLSPYRARPRLVVVLRAQSAPAATPFLAAPTTTAPAPGPIYRGDSLTARHRAYPLRPTLPAWTQRP